MCHLTRLVLQLELLDETNPQPCSVCDWLKQLTHFEELAGEGASLTGNFWLRRSLCFTRELISIEMLAHPVGTRI